MVDRVNVDIFGAALASYMAILLASVHRKRQELGRGNCARRRRRDRVVVRNHRRSIRSFRESRRGQRSVDGAVNRRKSVNRRELLLIDGRVSLLSVAGCGRLARLFSPRGWRRETRAADGTSQGGSTRVGSLNTAAVRCTSEGSGRGGKTTTLAVHAAIPPVLNCVVAAVPQSTSNLSPALAHVVHHALDHQAFISRNGLAVQRRLEVLVESLPALLGRPVVHVLRDANPVVGALFAHQLNKKLVLFRNPRASTVRVCHCWLCVYVCGWMKKR